MYLFDVFIRPGEGANHSFDAPDMASLAGSVDIPSPSSLYTEYTARNPFHFLVLRSYVTEIDLAAVVTGPVIGEVSQSTARVAGAKLPLQAAHSAVPPRWARARARVCLLMRTATT